MSERLERLQREIEAERQMVLAELGITLGGPLLVCGEQSVKEAVEKHLTRVPVQLRQEAMRRIQAVVLPWLEGRRVGGQLEA